MFEVESQNTTDPGRKAFEKLKNFFDLIDASELFDFDDQHFYSELRHEVRKSLLELLVWRRTLLESKKGFQWPYEGLRKRAPFFEKMARSEKDSMHRHQARLFLALLPFPNQWHWLMKFEGEDQGDYDIDAFLELEKQNIMEKISQRTQKSFKLRHFLQVLKKPNLPHEKGVLRIFSMPYVLAQPACLNRLTRKYFLYIEPTAGIVFRHAWWRHFSTLQDPCLFGVSSEEDARFLQSQPGTLTTNLAHGDFLNQKVPVRQGSRKSFDIGFNATFNDTPRKRHYFLLSLLKHPLLVNASALVVGRGDKGNIVKFKQRVHQDGLSNRVTVMSNLKRLDVPDQLTRCRVGVHLSLSENGCRCIYEFFQSDIPCAISTACAGVNMAIFNAETGMAATDHKLPEAISSMLANRSRYAPRKWFLSHSGSHHSTRELNRQLKDIFHRLGYGWKRDIVPLFSSGSSRYVSDVCYKQFRNEFEDLEKFFRGLQHFPITIKSDVALLEPPMAGLVRRIPLEIYKEYKQTKKHDRLF